MRRYRNVIADSARWAGFRFRDDDIVISTPPKSGTTWMQLLCVLLVHDATEFDRPLQEVAPWLDMQTERPERVLAALDAQPHRRVIKTHTPLDGIPISAGVTYVDVGRDPRDVAFSWKHHSANLDRDAVLAARAAAVGLADLTELGTVVPAGPAGFPSADSPDWFRRWTDDPPGPFGPTLSSVLHHHATFWARRDDPGVALFHYDDLLTDLRGEIRRLARILSIDLPPHRIDALAAAGGFERMRDRADALLPAQPLLRSNREFFHAGFSGQWRDRLDDQTLRHYRARVTELASPDLAAWLHSDTHSPGGG